MPTNRASATGLRRELEQLRARVAEAEETLDAIRNGEVDGLVVTEPDGHHVFTLKGAQEPYRLLVEQMSEGALTLAPDGVILYTNRAFARLLQLPLEQVIGAQLHDFLDPANRQLLNNLLEQAADGRSRGELSARAADGTAVLLRLGLSWIPCGAETLIYMVATDITEEHARKEELQQSNASLEKRVAERTSDIAGARLAALNMMEEALQSQAVIEASNRQLHQKVLERQQAEESLRESEARFRSYFELPLHGIIVTSVDKGWLAVNDRTCAMLGYTREEILRMNWATMTHPDDLAADTQQFNRVLAGHQDQYKLEKRFIRKDGTVIWTTISVGCVRKPDGRVDYLVCAMDDITALKQAEETLRKSDTRFNQLAELSGTVTWEVDAHGRYTYVSHVAEVVWGYQPAELVGTHYFYDLHPAAGRAEFKAAALAVFARKESFQNLENIVLAKDGRQVWVSTHGSPLFNTDGSLRGYRGSDTDITTRKLAEAELQKMQKLQSVGTLAGGIAHDFNNIMMGLFGNISLAKDGLAKEHPSHTLLEEAETSMNRAVRLTKQLLTFAKGGDPVKECVSLGALIEEVAKFDLSGSNVSLVYQQAPDLWQVEADRGQIQQVASNIIINARQAMAAGGHLHISLENAVMPAGAMASLPAGNYVKITIRDEGTGIEAKHLNRMFEPYFTTRPGGHGLGLATAYSIIHKHGGHISVASEPGQGTTFALYLPAIILPQPAEPEPPVVASSSMDRRANILVMDDEAVVRNIITLMLKSCGFTAATASDGHAALALYRQALEAGAPFDAVIMDLTIPGGMGGEETVKNLLALDPHATVIVSSGYADDPVMANYADYGFKGIATKPYTISELRAVLARVLQR